MVYISCLLLLLTDMTSSHLPISEYRSFLKLMKQPVLLPYPPAAFSQNALLVRTEVYLQVAFLGSPVVAVWTFERLFTSVSAHVKGKDAVEAEALSTQGAGILSVLAVVILVGVYL